MTTTSGPASTSIFAGRLASILLHQEIRERLTRPTRQILAGAFDGADHVGHQVEQGWLPEHGVAVAFDGLAHDYDCRHGDALTFSRRTQPALQVRTDPKAPRHGDTPPAIRRFVHCITDDGCHERGGRTRRPYRPGWSSSAATRFGAVIR